MWILPWHLPLIKQSLALVNASCSDYEQDNRMTHTAEICFAHAMKSM